MTARRLRAPVADGGMLVQPPPGAAGALLEANASLLTRWRYDFQGREASRLRDMVRHEVLATSAAFLRRHGLEVPAGGPLAAEPDSLPLVVTGHQPELFHPGVWVKNFAAAALAGSCGGMGLNLIVDSDIPKTSSIQVPRLENGQALRVPVEFDRWGGETPYEDLHIQDDELLSTFATRVRQVLGGLVADPVLAAFWPGVLRRRASVDARGLCFSLARRELEASWGVLNFEVPQSAICETEGFLWFAAHLLAQLPRYQQAYNGALAEYRLAHGLRSKNHPVPALSREGEWWEAPFWVWRSGEPRRRALLARQRARVMELRIAGEDRTLIELPLWPDGDACCAVARLRGLAAGAIRLRTRALTTTMFSRFLLGDLFIHGLGGAKYEELGDEIARRFFGIEPPGFLTLSMTLWLGLPLNPATEQDLASIQRTLRDLRFNPDRHLSEPYADEVRNLIKEKCRAIAAGRAPTHAERVARWHTIGQCNLALQPWVRERLDESLKLQASTEERLRSNQTARNREFAYVLHSAERLREILTRSVATW